MPPEHLGLSRHGFFHRGAISRWKNAACTRSRPFRAARIEGELSLSIRPRPSPRAAMRAANTAAPIAMAATRSESSFFDALLGLSKCGNSFWGSMRASGVPARWRSRGKGGRQDTKNRTGAHSGGACRRHVQTLVCTPDDTRHTACTTIAKIKSAMCHGALWPYRAVEAAARARRRPVPPVDLIMQC